MGRFEKGVWAGGHGWIGESLFLGNLPNLRRRSLPPLMLTQSLDWKTRYIRKRGSKTKGKKVKCKVQEWRNGWLMFMKRLESCAAQSLGELKLLEVLSSSNTVEFFCNRNYVVLFLILSVIIVRSSRYCS